MLFFRGKTTNLIVPVNDWIKRNEGRTKGIASLYINVFFFKISIISKIFFQS